MVLEILNGAVAVPHLVQIDLSSLFFRCHVGGVK